jgi:hypothetical protein
MMKFEFETPLLISGVYINEETLKHLSYVQTGTWWINDDSRKHNNEGINDYLNDINSIINHLLGNLVEADNKEKPKIINLLETAYFLHSTFDKLKLPEELLTA